jgi:peptidyl-dipeptidase Dcp
MMKKAGVAIMTVLLFACTPQEENPLLTTYQTPFGIPPFNAIKEHHYMPAFKEGIKQQNAAIETIIVNPEESTFENTVVALDNSGMLIHKVYSVFDNLVSAHTNDELQRLSKEVEPMLAAHNDEIRMNTRLFDRIKVVYEQRETLSLTGEQERLLEKWYKDFVRSGANLNEEEKEQLKKINQQLSVLSVQFAENVLKENNAFELVIDNEDDLTGLPDNLVAGAAEAASQKGLSNKWLFTIQKPVLIPFLQYAQKRNLREKMFKAYINRGDNNDLFDNKQIIKQIIALRIQKAKLLGYETPAHYILDDRMAKTPEQVYDLLNKLWKPAVKRAEQEVEAMQALIGREGLDFKLEPWDWWYYAEKLKKEMYALDDEILRPYFKLENVRDGAFMLANKLFGITFEEIKGTPIYHPEVKVFEVKEGNGQHIGILLMDFFPRESKRNGAWMSSYRKQQTLDGEPISPIIVNVCNFTKPVGDKPSLLTQEEVETLFHEFGHGLHGLLSQCTYYSISGTSVKRDFVELPSQIMENWAEHPQFLKQFARHYQTGEPIPNDLIEKIKEASLFNQGFKTVEYLAASFLDMDWHVLSEPPTTNVNAFERNALSKIGLIPEIVSRYRTTNFLHIFSWEYEAGYYSYIWAEVLDADAFQAFIEKGLFDKETAASLRKNIFAAGDSEDPMVLFRQFRGRDPEIAPLLEKRGLN